MKFKLILPEGSKGNPFYGHAYRDLNGADLEIYYLIPFNWIFKLFRRISIIWYKLIFKRDWVDIEINKGAEYYHDYFKNYFENQMFVKIEKALKKSKEIKW